MLEDGEPAHSSCSPTLLAADGPGHIHHRDDISDPRLTGGTLSKIFSGLFFMTLSALKTELWDVKAVCPPSSALALSQLAPGPNAWILLYLLLLLQTSSS